MVSGPPSGQLLQVTLLRHWLFFFQNIFHIRCFRLPASDKKNKRGTKESWWYCYGAGWSGDQVSIVVARVGGDTSSPREQSQSANRRSALHLRSNHWQIACHTLHMDKHWRITGETENSEKCKISTLPPHTKVESTDHIFSAIATAANLPISWVAHKGKPQSKNLLNLLLGNFLDFCSGDRWPWRTCIVMVSRSTYDPCSQGPCMAQVPKCVWLFASLCSANWCICLSALSFQEICCTFYPFDRQVPTVHWRFIGSVTTFHAKTAKCESCNSSISHFHFLLTLRYVCISFAKPIGAFEVFFFVWGVKFGNQVCIDPSACLTS